MTVAHAQCTQLLEERPVWLRHSLLRQFSESDRHVIITSVILQLPPPGAELISLWVDIRATSQQWYTPSVQDHSGSASVGMAMIHDKMRPPESESSRRR